MFLIYIHFILVVSNHIDPSSADISLLAILIGVAAPMFVLLSVLVIRRKLCTFSPSHVTVNLDASTGEMYPDNLAGANRSRSRLEDMTGKGQLTADDASRSYEDINPDVVPSRGKRYSWQFTFT